MPLDQEEGLQGVEKSLYPICGDSGPTLRLRLHGEMSTSGGKDLGLWEIPQGTYLVAGVVGASIRMALCDCLPLSHTWDH